MCPACRSYNLRRRKRDSFILNLVSWVGQWPYQCENCGGRFFLRKRYVRRKGEAEQTSLPGDVPEA